MKVYCPSSTHKYRYLVGDITGHVRKGAVMVCAECLERYRIADQMAKQVRDQVQSNPEVEKLMGIFNMR